MQNTHPTQTAGDGKSLRDIKHKAKNEKSESIRISCPHCGFFYNKERDARPDANEGGISHVEISIAIPGGTKSFKEPQVTSGCPLCGHDAENSTYHQPFYSTINLQGR